MIVKNRRGFRRSSDIWEELRRLEAIDKNRLQGGERPRDGELSVIQQHMQKVGNAQIPHKSLAETEKESGIIQ